MLNDTEEFKSLVYTVTEIAKADNLEIVVELLVNSEITIEQTDYDNWNGGTYGYTIYIVVDVKGFINIKDQIADLETLLLENFCLVTRHLENERISKVTFIPKGHATGMSSPNPHRPFSIVESKRREDLADYLNKVSEDELIEEILLPLFRQLGFHRITSAGHKDKALEVYFAYSTYSLLRHPSKKRKARCFWNK